MTETLLITHQSSGQRRESVLRYERDGAGIDAKASERNAKLVQEHLIVAAEKLPAVVRSHKAQHKLALAEQGLKELELEQMRAQNERPKATGKASGETLAATAVKKACDQQSFRERLATTRQGISILHAEAMQAENEARDAVKEFLSVAFQNAKTAIRAQEEAAHKQLVAMKSVVDEMATLNRIDELCDFRLWSSQIEQHLAAILSDAPGDGEQQ